MATERDEALIRRHVLALHAIADAPCAAAPCEVADGTNQIGEARFIVEGELEHTQLFTRPTFDQRCRVRERESYQLRAREEQHRVTKREIVGERDLARVVVSRG